MLEYQLGDMKGIDGSALRYEVKKKNSELAVRISSAVESTSIYSQLAKKLVSKRLLLYFQYSIKKEIYPYIRQACVIQWYKRNGKSTLYTENTVKVPKFGVFLFLKECWDFENIPIIWTNPIIMNFNNSVLMRKYVKDSAKNIIRKILRRFEKSNNLTFSIGQKEHIACHFAEGIDVFRRNDLNWYYKSGIEPERILIYFDNIYSKTGKPIEREIIQKIEQQDFKWTTLKKGVVDYKKNYWLPPSIPKDWLLKKSMAKTSCEKWITKVGNNLLTEVHYWRSFYKAFNIRIHYVPEEREIKNIAQAIAFDIEREKPGILVGRQRSEVFLPLISDIGYQPKHIFFVWNKRVKTYFSPNYKQNEMLVITGYPYNIFEKYEKVDSLDFLPKLRSKGVNFIISMFDNMYGPDIHFSKKGMIEFYQSILQWILDDPTVGLIIKSKKPFVINNLPEIHSLLNRALKTDRCIKIENEFGRFPSEASSGADMAIGCGISSAVIEAVIGGCRGIHYDITKLKSHEFYKWGYEKLIFDNLDRMMESLKKYKENSQNNSELGDWSPYMDKLDPFQDGKGGERMGSYIRWLLESFDNGKNRDEAMQYANKLYAEQWGSDKIIPMSVMT